MSHNITHTLNGNVIITQEPIHSEAPVGKENKPTVVIKGRKISNQYALTDDEQPLLENAEIVFRKTHHPTAAKERSKTTNMDATKTAKKPNTKKSNAIKQFKMVHSITQPVLINKRPKTSVSNDKKSQKPKKDKKITMKVKKPIKHKSNDKMQDLLDEYGNIPENKAIIPFSQNRYNGQYQELADTLAKKNQEYYAEQRKREKEESEKEYVKMLKRKEEGYKIELKNKEKIAKQLAKHKLKEAKEATPLIDDERMKINEELIQKIRNNKETYSPYRLSPVPKNSKQKKRSVTMKDQSKKEEAKPAKPQLSKEEQLRRAELVQIQREKQLKLAKKQKKKTNNEKDKRENHLKLLNSEIKAIRNAIKVKPKPEAIKNRSLSENSYSDYQDIKQIDILSPDNAAIRSNAKSKKKEIVEKQDLPIRKQFSNWIEPVKAHSIVEDQHFLFFERVKKIREQKMKMKEDAQNEDAKLVENGEQAKDKKEIKSPTKDTKKEENKKEESKIKETKEKLKENTTEINKKENKNQGEYKYIIKEKLELLAKRLNYAIVEKGTDMPSMQCTKIAATLENKEIEANIEQPPKLRDEETEMTQNEGATIIQKYVKGYLTRLKLKKQRAEFAQFQRKIETNSHFMIPFPKLEHSEYNQITLQPTQVGKKPIEIAPNFEEEVQFNMINKDQMDENNVVDLIMKHITIQDIKIESPKPQPQPMIEPQEEIQNIYTPTKEVSKEIKEESIKEEVPQAEQDYSEDFESESQTKKAGESIKENFEVSASKKPTDRNSMAESIKESIKECSEESKKIISAFKEPKDVLKTSIAEVSSKFKIGASTTAKKEIEKLESDLKDTISKRELQKQLNIDNEKSLQNKLIQQNQNQLNALVEINKEYFNIMKTLTEKLIESKGIRGEDRHNDVTEIKRQPTKEDSSKLDKSAVLKDNSLLSIKESLVGLNVDTTELENKIKEINKIKQETEAVIKDKQVQIQDGINKEKDRIQKETHILTHSLEKAKGISVKDEIQNAVKSITDKQPNISIENKIESTTTQKTKPLNEDESIQEESPINESISNSHVQNKEVKKLEDKPLPQSTTKNEEESIAEDIISSRDGTLSKREDKLKQSLKEINAQEKKADTEKDPIKDSAQKDEYSYNFESPSSMSNVDAKGNKLSEIKEFKPSEPSTEKKAVEIIQSPAKVDDNKPVDEPPEEIAEDDYSDTFEKDEAKASSRALQSSSEEYDTEAKKSGSDIDWQDNIGDSDSKHQDSQSQEHEEEQKEAKRKEAEEIAKKQLEDQASQILEAIMKNLVTEVKSDMYPKRKIEVEKPLSSLASLPELKLNKAPKQAPPKPKGIPTDLEYVSRYLNEIFNLVTSKHLDQFEENIAIPISKSPLYIMGQIQNEEQQYYNELDNVMSQPVLPLEWYMEIENHNKEESKPTEEPVEFKSIHNKGIFDALNDALDMFRPYGIKGPTLPWSNKFREISSKVKSTQEIIKVAKEKVLFWGAFAAGCLSTEIKPHEKVPNLAVGEDLLSNINEEKLKKVLVTEVR